MRADGAAGAGSMAAGCERVFVSYTLGARQRFWGTLRGHVASGLRVAPRKSSGRTSSTRSHRVAQQDARS